MSLPIHPHSLQVKQSRTRIDQRSFCQRAVLYQARHGCVASRYLVRSRSLLIGEETSGRIVARRGAMVRMRGRLAIPLDRFSVPLYRANDETVGANHLPSTSVSQCVT